MQLSRQPYAGIQSSAKWTARRRVFYVTLWFLSCTALWTHHHRCPLVLGRPLFIALVGYKTYFKSALLWWHILSTRSRTLSGHLMKVQFTQSPNVEMLESEIVGSSTHNQLSKTVWSLSHSFWTVPETVRCSPRVWALLYPFAIPSQY
jgi:hypothetical protein